MTTATRHATRPASPTAPDWSQAVCAQTDPDLFFPDGVGNAITSQVKQAKKICAGCPVKAACLDWAIETGQVGGVWGGLDQDERRPLARGRTVRRIPMSCKGPGYKEHRYGPQYATAAEGILGTRLAQVRELVGREAAVGEMAAALQTNAQTVRKVLEGLAEMGETA